MMTLEDLIIRYNGKPLGDLWLFEVDQGSADWLELRMGRPTASEFHRIVQPGGEPRFKKNGEPYKSSAGELADGRWTYAYELAIERLLDQGKDTIEGLKPVQRGKMLEADAVRHYERAFDPESARRTAKAGFIMPAHARWGCSPDRILCDELGGVEIKCPYGPKQIEYWNDGPGTNYRCQVQGSLMITKFPNWDFYAFHPNLPEVDIRFPRDEKFIEKLETGLNQFCAEVDELCERIKREGYVPPDHVGKMVRRPLADNREEVAGQMVRAGNMGG